MLHIWPFPVLCKKAEPQSTGQVLSLSDFACQEEELAPPGFLVLHDCIVQKGANGLHDRMGQPILESNLRRGHRYPFGSIQPLPIPAGEPSEILESVLFLPLVQFRHFGHMLTDSAGWLSALLDPAFDVRHWLDPETTILLAAHCERSTEALIPLLGLHPDRVRSTQSISAWALCRKVLIPRPSLILNVAIHGSHFQTVRRFVDRWYALDSSPLRERRDRVQDSFVGREAHQKIYLSRSRLHSTQRKIQGEKKLERELAKRGWRIVYPETLPIIEQLEALRFARVIAGSIGSAFHLLMYFGLELAGTAVIGLEVAEASIPATYVFQFRHQGLNFRLLCCLKPVRRIKTRLSPRRQDLMLSAPARLIARQIEDLASQLEQKG
jgi:hypothetical protein